MKKLFIISVLFSSCIVKKDINTTDIISTKDYLQVAISDYTNRYPFTNKDSIFKIFFETDTSKCNVSELKCFAILPMMQSCILFEEDTIGGKSKYVFNQYIIQKDKVFLWVDTTKVINKETLDLMKSYNKLKSVTEVETVMNVLFYKNQRCYSFCKDNFHKYKSSKFWRNKKRKPIHKWNCKSQVE